MDSEENKNLENKDLEIIMGENSDLEISEVGDMINDLKPNTSKEKKSIIIPISMNKSQNVNNENNNENEEDEIAEEDEIVEEDNFENNADDTSSETELNESEKTEE